MFFKAVIVFLSVSTLLASDYRENCSKYMSRRFTIDELVEAYKLEGNNEAVAFYRAWSERQSERNINAFMGEYELERPIDVPNNHHVQFLKIAFNEESMAFRFFDEDSGNLPPEQMFLAKKSFLPYIVRKIKDGEELKFLVNFKGDQTYRGLEFFLSRRPMSKMFAARTVAKLQVRGYRENLIHVKAEIRSYRSKYIYSDYKTVWSTSAIYRKVRDL